MKIWLEALTGKQALLVHHLAQKLEEEGHEIIITSRPYSVDRSNSNLDRLGREHHSIGTYGGAKLADKLIAGSKRIIELTELIVEENPDLLISFPSPDAFRTAFGLGIKSIQINDTPYSYAPAKLTISLSDALVFSSSIPQREFEKSGVTRYYPYDGVDEVLWLKDPSFSLETLDFLNLTPKNYIVVRCEESKAGYFQSFFPEITPGSTIVPDLVKSLRDGGYDHKVVAFPRYPEQEKVLREIDVIIPEKSVDTVSLFYYASLLMTAGGTMAREAALLGVPAIYTFPIASDVSNFVEEKGFPIYHCTDLQELPRLMLELINSSAMDEVKKQVLIDQLETPFDGILRVFKDLDLS